jgi:hypothetical protein
MLRDVALAVVMALVVREIRHPHLDVVRRDGDDDPAGGVLDGARDRGDVDERWFADYGGVPATR